MAEAGRDPSGDAYTSSRQRRRWIGEDRLRLHNAWPPTPSSGVRVANLLVIGSLIRRPWQQFNAAAFRKELSERGDADPYVTLWLTCG
jgi:hypothetical protein